MLRCPGRREDGINREQWRAGEEVADLGRSTFRGQLFLSRFEAARDGGDCHETKNQFMTQKEGAERWLFEGGGQAGTSWLQCPLLPPNMFSKNKFSTVGIQSTYFPRI